MTPASRLVPKAQGTLRAHLNHDHRLLVVRFAVLMSNQVPSLLAATLSIVFHTQNMLLLL